MSLLYLDSSALLKRYLVEENSEDAKRIMLNSSNHCLSHIGIAEILISLKKRLGARDFLLASRLFEADLNSIDIIPFDEEICAAAVEVADGKNLATLDSIHIASALRFKDHGITFLTYDKSQGLAAKSIGLKTLGVVS